MQCARNHLCWPCPRPHVLHNLCGLEVQRLVAPDPEQGDGKTEMLRRATEAAGGEWCDVAHLSEHELAELVRSDGVQVLVELTGHTANNRLGVCALRPAPVQVRPLVQQPEYCMPSRPDWCSGPRRHLWPVCPFCR